MQQTRLTGKSTNYKSPRLQSVMKIKVREISDIIFNHYNETYSMIWKKTKIRVSYFIFKTRKVHGTTRMSTRRLTYYIHTLISVLIIHFLSF